MKTQEGQMAVKFVQMMSKEGLTVGQALKVLHTGIEIIGRVSEDVALPLPSKSQMHGILTFPQRPHREE